MVRLALIVGAASAAALVSAAQFEERDISGMWDDNVAMMKRFEQETAVLQQRDADLSFLQTMMDDPNWWAKDSGMDNAFSAPKPNHFGNFHIGQPSPKSQSHSTSTYQNGNTRVTVNSSTDNNQDFSNNTGSITFKRRANPAPAPSAKPAAKPADNKPKGAPAAPKKNDAKKPAPGGQDKNAAPGGQDKKPVLPIQNKTTVNNTTQNKSDIKVNNSKTDNNVSIGNTQNNLNNKSTNNAADLGSNSGTIDNSGNSYGEYNACTVMIEERSFVDGVLEARMQKRSGDINRRGKFAHCACNCGNRKRSIQEPAPHARSFETVLERSCSIVQDPQGQHFTTGSCSKSTLAGRDITSILPSL